MVSPYHRVPLEQGSSQCSQWQREGIVAADAAAILGENPAKSRAQLLREKCDAGQAQGSNAAMAINAALQPRALKAYCDHVGAVVEPACLQSEQQGWLRASVDGLSPCGRHLVEIKSGRLAYEQAARFRQVPFHYQPLLQHALAVTGLETMDFWCYWPGSWPVHLKVPRDESYIKRLLDAETEFWNELLTAGFPGGSAASALDQSSKTD